MSIKNILLKSIELLSNPYSIIVRIKGGISDFYLKYDKPWFHNLEIDTVLDVGGNIGQFSKTMRLLLPKAKIYAFEPLADCYLQMEKLMQDDINYKGFNIGLGDKKDTLTMQKSSYAPSSSFLKMSQKHKEAFPQTAGNEAVTVEVCRLDDIIREIEIGKNILIKVDVQGYEAMVLKGGLETFAKAKVLIMELSFQELYEKQPLFNDIYQELEKIGFKFMGVSAQMASPQDSQFLDADCIFVKY
jgi:FkbM family methyltransferase